MARKDDKFSNLSKELDEEFDYESEIEEIERQDFLLQYDRRKDVRLSKGYIGRNYR